MRIETIFENFELLTDAPNAVTKLREVILQLAVQGKLIAQNYNDEPVNSLIDTARNQLEKLIKEKGYRNSEILLPIKEDEIPHNIPQNWNWVRIGEIALIRGGKRLPQGASFAIEPTPRIYIQVTNMKNGTILNQDLKYLDQEVYQVIKNYIIEKDDLYISIAGTIGQVGEVPEIFHQMNLTENAARIIFRELDKKYFSITLNSELVQNQFKRETNQQAQPKLALKRIANAIISLPPLAEQKRIVEKCDRLLSLCDKMEVRQQKRQESIVRVNENAITQLLSSQNPDEFRQQWQRICNNFDLLYSIPETIPKLRQAILQLAVQGKLVRQDPNDEPVSLLLERIQSEREALLKDKIIPKYRTPPACEEAEMPFRLPYNWKWVRLGALCFQVADGPHFSPSYVSKHEGVPFLSTRNIRVNGIDLDSAKYISHKDYVEFCKRIKPEFGDILYTKGGTTGLAVVNTLSCEFNVWVHVAVLKIVKSSVYPHYLAYALNSPHCYIQSQKYTHGSSNRDLGLTRMVLITIPLPPLTEQKRIVAKVDRLMSLCNTVEAKLKEARSRSEMLMEVAAKQVLML